MTEPNEANLEQLKTEKAELEQNFLSSMRAFEKKFGVQVSDIYLEDVGFSNGSSQSIKVRITVEI